MTSEVSTNRTSLNRHFSLALIGVVTVVVLLFFSITIWFSARANERELERRLEQHAKFATVSLSSAIWNIDEKGISDVVDALFLDDAVVHVSVIELQEGQTAEQRTREGFDDQGFAEFSRSGEFLTSTSDVLHPDYGDEKIGLLQLAVSRAGLREQFWLQVASSATLTVALVVAISITSLLINRRHRPSHC